MSLRNTTYYFTGLVTLIFVLMPGFLAQGADTGMDQSGPKLHNALHVAATSSFATSTHSIAERTGLHASRSKAFSQEDTSEDFNYFLALTGFYDSLDEDDKNYYPTFTLSSLGNHYLQNCESNRNATFNLPPFGNLSLSLLSTVILLH